MSDFSLGEFLFGWIDNSRESGNVCERSRNMASFCPDFPAFIWRGGMGRKEEKSGATLGFLSQE
jgi:hypothetical protein